LYARLAYHRPVHIFHRLFLIKVIGQALFQRALQGVSWGRKDPWRRDHQFYFQKESQVNARQSNAVALRIQAWFGV
jgi:hypothetical protein